MAKVRVNRAQSVTSINGATGNVEIHCRNYLHTPFPLVRPGWTGTDFKDHVSLDGEKIEITGPGEWNAYNYVNEYLTTDIYPFEIGDVLIFSVDVRFNQFSPGAYFVCDSRTAQSKNRVEGTRYTISPDMVNKWVRAKSVLTVQYENSRMLFSFSNRGEGIDDTGLTIEYKNAAVYRNTGIADYLPAPEDIVSRLEALEAKNGIVYEPPVAEGPSFEEPVEGPEILMGGG